MEIPKQFFEDDAAKILSVINKSRSDGKLPVALARYTYNSF